MPGLDFFSDYTLRIVMMGAAALGVTSGALGSYAVLRKQSLLGDAISHAALPGIVLAFLLTGSKAPLVLVLGAAVAGWIGTLVVITVVGATRTKEDAALGMVLSVFFGIGLLLLTYVQKQPRASQAGLDRFLFGQAATLLQRDVAIIAGLGGLALLAAALLWKEFKLLSFDPDFGRALGLPMRAIDILLTTVLVISIVIGLQTVGVVLMSAMVVAPASAARQWTDRMAPMVLLAGFFGALAGISGAVLSSTAARLPTGPTIVLCLTAIVLVSLTLAPNRGLLWNSLRQRRAHRQLRTGAVLADLYALALQHEDPEHGHSVATLQAMRQGRGSAHRSLEALRDQGLVRQTSSGEWTITEKGAQEAQGAGGEEQDAE